MSVGQRMRKGHQMKRFFRSAVVAAFVTILCLSAILTSCSGDRERRRETFARIKRAEEQVKESRQESFGNDEENIYPANELAPMDVSLAKAFYSGTGPEQQLNLVLKATVVSSQQIIQPKTHQVWANELGTRAGASPTGFLVQDGFGNDLGLVSVNPQFVGAPSERGLSPGESMLFTVVVSMVNKR